MVDRFWDPEGGNDANDGLSFANRKKTLASFGTVSAGDRIKTIASHDPINLGSGVWTDNSGTVTFPSGVLKVIDDFNTAWTPSTNVTCTTTTARKSGSTATSIAIASAFTTGKVAYYTLPSAVDLSAFTMISGWLFSSVALASGAVEIRFCSDTAGDVPVFTVQMNDTGGSLPANSWYLALADNAAALPSNIQSVSLYANTDPGTATIRLNNFIATASPGSAGCLHHNCLIGKSTSDEPWRYNIFAFSSDTSLVLGAGSVSVVASTPPMPYRGVSETSDVYCWSPILLKSATDTNWQLNGDGSFASPITLSGGWDRVSMSTQDGISILSGGHLAGTIFYTTGPNFATVEKIGFANMRNSGIYLLKNGGNHQIEGVWGNGLGLFQTASAISDTSGIVVKVKDAWGILGQLLNVITGTNISAPMDIWVGRISGNPSTAPVGTIRNIGWPGISCRIDEVSNNKSYGIEATTGYMTELKGTVFKYNAAGDVHLSGKAACVSLIGCSLLSDTTYVSDSNYTNIFRTTAEGGDPTKYRTVYGNSVVMSAADQTHSGAGVALKFLPGTVSNTVDFPLQSEIAQVAVQAGSPVTVKVWGRRSDAGLSLGIGAKEGYIAGVSEVNAHMTAAADTWEQITLAFTPTTAGVLPIYGYAYGGTTFSGWLDDLTIDQKEYIELDLLSGVPDMFTFARASKAWDFNSAGVLTEFADGVARQVYDPTTLAVRGTRVEPASSTNQARNPRAEGANAGTNTLPANWGTYATNGLTRTVVGSGVEDGIPYVDVRWQGTTTGTATATIFPEPNAQIAALTGQTWTGSWFVRLMAGTVASNFTLNVIEYTSAGAFVTGNGLNIATVTSAPLRTQRSAWTRTLSGGATVAGVNAPITQSWPVGTVVDVTLRFGIPQIEQAGYASSPILPPAGSPNVSTRATEALALALPYAGFPGVTGWTAMLEFMPLRLPGNVTALGLGGSSGNFSAGIVGGDNKLYATKSVAGTNVASSGTTATVAAGAVNKIVMAQDTTDIRASLNGSAVISASNAGYPAMTAMNILSTQPGCARKIRMWLYKLLDADLPGQST